MGEGPEHEVERVGYWRQIENRRKVGIAAGLAVAVLAAAAAIVFSASRQPEGDLSEETSRTITPAQETAEATVTVPSYEETPTAEVGSPDPVVTPPPIAPAFARAPVVAYRRAGMLCIAAEDGTGERRLVASGAGVFALSPDGGALAFVDAETGALVVVDTASGARADVGPATQDVPSWAPDSAWIAYSAPGPKVMRVERSGTSAKALFAGTMPSVSVADGTVVGLDPSGSIAVYMGGAISRVRAAGTVTGLATDGAAIYYGTMSSADGSTTLRVVGAGGGGDRVLVSRTAATRAVTFGDLTLTPDAARLAFTERGDDGYSRLFVMAASGVDTVSLSVRRDCYPLRWTADGSGLFFIEGNAIQGEPTALMRVAADGGFRRLLTQDARQ